MGPDEGRKSSQNFPYSYPKSSQISPKVAQKVATSDYIQIATLLKLPKTFKVIWAIMHEHLSPRPSKIAQSGNIFHTFFISVSYEQYDQFLRNLDTFAKF